MLAGLCDVALLQFTRHQELFNFYFGNIILYYGFIQTLNNSFPFIQLIIVTAHTCIIFK